MRVLVTGGRDYSDDAVIRGTLRRIRDSYGISLVIHGGAQGADFRADQWARQNSIPCLRHPARWHIHGNKAGPLRNQQMLDDWLPDLVVAFPGGRGTADMVSRSERLGIKVVTPKDFVTPQESKT